MASLRKLREVPGLQKLPKDERGWVHFMNELGQWMADAIAFEVAQADIITAQTAADDAQTDATTAISDAATAQTDATTAISDASTAQTSADNSGAYWVNTPSGQVWNSDTAGVHEAGDPDQDILFTLYDTAGTAIATRTLKGSMTTASGSITISTTGTPTGLTTVATYDPATNADVTVKANMKATFADGSVIFTSASWSSVDLTAAGGTPGSGAGK